MNNKKNLYNFFFLLLLLFVFSSFSWAKSGGNVVRVAYFNIGNYYKKLETKNGNFYDNEFLAKISLYSDLEFEFVDCSTWDRALDALEKHEVDLVGTSQWSEDRQKKFDYCLEKCGYTIAELATLPEKKIIFEDYEAIGKSTIGCTQNYIRLPELRQLLKNRNISPEIKFYPTQQALEKAFLAGEFDIIAANSHTLLDGLNIIEKIEFTPYFFMTWKGNRKLVQEIDRAITQLNLQEPYFDDILLKKYFSELLGYPLSKAELDYINEQHQLIVYVDDFSKPFSYIDNTTGLFKGVYSDIIESINDLTGLNIFLKYESEKNNNEAPIFFEPIYENSSVDISHEKGVTHPILTVPFSFYYSVNFKPSGLVPGLKVGIVARSNFEQFLKEKFPYIDFFVYNTPAETLSNLEKGKIDFVILNKYTANSYLITNSITDIREFPSDSINVNFGLHFYGKNQDMLVSIVNKELDKLDYSLINNNLIQYVLDSRPIINISYILKNHFKIFIFVLSILIFLTLSGIISSMYAVLMRQQRDKIELYNKERSAFFARMSHDMRTPMNGVLGMIDLSLESKNLSVITENLKKAKSAGLFMLSLLNDTLDLQRLNSNKIKIEPKVVSGQEVIDDFVSMVKPSAEQKNIDFIITRNNIDTNFLIEIDPVRVEEIFSNLITNAIKFTPEHGKVELIMECLSSDQLFHHDRFIIRDSGIGMSEDFIQNKIFKPFMQEQSDYADKVAGSGLGLAIVKQLVELMGGRIEVESTLGKGTQFTLYLDFKIASQTAIAETEKKSNKSVLTDKDLEVLNGKKILMCEDNKLNAEIAIHILKKAKCLVTWESDGKKGFEAFSLSAENEFDAIIMDIRMPIMDGLETTSAIRLLNRSDSKTIPIIAMTANAYDSDIEKSKEVGMNAHLTKPINAPIFYKTLINFFVKK